MWILSILVSILFWFGIGYLFYYFLVKRNKEKPVGHFKKRRENMTNKERMQEQITIELEQSARTDATVVRTAIGLNIILLAVNSSIAAAAHENGAMMMILIVLIAVVIVINVVVARALSRGKERRVKLTEGLKKMFEGDEMAEIYDSTVMDGYKTRYDMFTTVILSLGLAAVVVPLIALVACEGF